jgi:hypothetical protein
MMIPGVFAAEMVRHAVEQVFNAQQRTDAFI